MKKHTTIFSFICIFIAGFTLALATYSPAWAAVLPVRVFSNNLHVCTGSSCVTTAPGGTGNLIVEGQIKIAGGTPGAGKVLTSDANGLATWQAAGGVPSGMVVAFTTTCPSGWTEYTAARGRYIVGVPSGGTLAGANGTALTNLEDRAVGLHSHGVYDAGHWHYVRADNDDCCGGDGGLAFPYQSGVSGDLGAGYIRATFANVSSVSLYNAGTVGGTNAPYIQLYYCQKT